MQATPLIVQTDQGFILKSIKNDNGYVIDRGITNIDLNQYNPTPTLTFFEVQIRPATQKMVITRQYKKFQDILGETTGVASLVAILTIILIKPYRKIKRQELMIDIVLAPTPNDTIHISLKDYINATFGSKEAKEKIQRLNEQAFIVENKLNILNVARTLSTMDKYHYILFLQHNNY